MNTFIPTRQNAFDLLNEYNTKPGLIRYALAVEAVMARFAEKFGEDAERSRSNRIKRNSVAASCF